MFPPSFYDQLEDRLNLAVFDTNQDWRRKQMLFTKVPHKNDQGVDYIPVPDAGSTMADPTSPATFATATASVLKPAAPPAPATKAATCAARLSQLAKDRIAFNQELSADVDAYAKRMTDVKSKKVDVFKKAHAVLDDEIAGLGSVDDSLTEFEGANGAPLAG